MFKKLLCWSTLSRSKLNFILDVFIVTTSLMCFFVIIDVSRNYLIGFVTILSLLPSTLSVFLCVLGFEIIEEYLLYIFGVVISSCCYSRRLTNFDSFIVFKFVWIMALSNCLLLKRVFKGKMFYFMLKLWSIISLGDFFNFSLIFFNFCFGVKMAPILVWSKSEQKLFLSICLVFIYYLSLYGKSYLCLKSDTHSFYEILGGFR